MISLRPGALDGKRLIVTALVTLLFFTCAAVIYSHEAIKPQVNDAFEYIKETAVDVYEDWIEPNSIISLEADAFLNGIDEPSPKVDFSIYADLPPAHLEEFEKDRYVFATMYCTRRETPRDPYLAAVQQMIWRVLWSSFASRHPIVVFVCPFISQEARDLFKAQGAWVEELPLVQPPVEQEVQFSRWADQFSKINLWNFTQFDIIAYLDTDALPIANLDSIFDVVQTQHCKTSLLEHSDLDTLETHGEDFCDYLFAGVLDRNPFNFAEYQDVNGGVLVLRPNSHIHLRLLFNSHRVHEYEAVQMEQSFLSSKLAFGPTGPFPAQHISPIYNFGGENIHRLALAEEEGEQRKEPALQLESDFDDATPITNDRVLVIHDKLWWASTFVNRNPAAPYWNEMWLIDWMRMCRHYGSPNWPTLRTKGRMVSGEDRVTEEDVRKAHLEKHPSRKTPPHV